MFNNRVPPPFPSSPLHILRVYCSHCFFSSFAPSLLQLAPPFPYLGFFFSSHITSTCRGKRGDAGDDDECACESILSPGRHKWRKKKNNTTPRLPIYYYVYYIIYYTYLRWIGPDLLTIIIIFIIPMSYTVYT